MVAGLGGYAMWDGQIYGAFTLYRSAELGNGGPPNSDSEDTLESTAPYWRLAWQHGWGANYLELGTYGIYAKLYANGAILGVASLEDKPERRAPRFWRRSPRSAAFRPNGRPTRRWRSTRRWASRWPESGRW